MTESSTPQRQGRAAAVLAFGRNTWRGLTSMRTALILLFLLAVAALPGALLPQYSLNAVKVAEYIKQYPTLGPILDDLGFFAVYGAPWFAAIYVLLFGYEGQVIVLANGSQFCNSGIYAYDSFRPGLTVDGTELNPFCVRVDSMESRYFDDLQPDRYRAQVAYQDAHELSGPNWRTAELEVNSPVRLSGDRVYLLGTGYAPRFVVTFPGGEQRVGQVQWKPMDMVTLLSEGATKFDPPGVTDSEERRKKQLAITGLFAPTAGYHGSVLTSIFPEARDPAVAVDIYRGDLGNESGRGQSIFEIDKSMVDSGRLTKVLRKNLAMGEEVTLDDGTKVRFDGVEQWVSLQVSSDPAQFAVLLAGLAVLVGLGLSLIIKRRRLWVRLSPAGDGRTLIEVGGLARTDQAGYGEEFTRVATELFAARGKDK